MIEKCIKKHGNHAPIKHHPVTKHPSCAYQHRWMVVVLCVSVKMQPYDQTPGLEKMSLNF
jgi:hypothetical protein